MVEHSRIYPIIIKSPIFSALLYRYHAYEPLVKMTVSTSELNDALGKFKEDNYLSEFEF